MTSLDFSRLKKNAHSALVVFRHPDKETAAPIATAPIATAPIAAAGSEPPLLRPVLTALALGLAYMLRAWLYAMSVAMLYWVAEMCVRIGVVYTVGVVVWKILEECRS